MDAEQQSGPPPGPRIKTPSQILIEAMEAFGTEEPDCCAIIFTTPAGRMSYYFTHPYLPLNVGLLEMARCQLMKIAMGSSQRE